jgi:hypothetical protein
MSIGLIFAFGGMIFCLSKNKDFVIPLPAGIVGAIFLLFLALKG